ncbi:MAG: hypothetical protein FWG36_09330 [Oscillospiraceae bacterium]|nr:hypothetical protein [Oscillospiraceae bacterium]
MYHAQEPVKDKPRKRGGKPSLTEPIERDLCCVPRNTRQKGAYENERK